MGGGGGPKNTGKIVLRVGRAWIQKYSHIWRCPKQSTPPAEQREPRHVCIQAAKCSNRKYHNKSIFAEDDLKLYFKFNEPSGSYNADSNNSSLVLDHSGNSLHGKISNFSMELRNARGIQETLKLEESYYSPVLFPSYNKISNLATELVQSGSEYDFNNPNLITRMIPKHYLIDAAVAEGMDEEGEISDSYTYYEDEPGKANMPSSQVISSMLFLWAEKFDEIKIFVDEYSRFLKIDYNDKNTVSDQMLPFLAKYYGFELPELFRGASENQTLDGGQITLNPVTGSVSLQKIQ